MSLPNEIGKDGLIQIRRVYVHSVSNGQEAINQIERNDHVAKPQRRE